MAIFTFTCPEHGNFTKMLSKGTKSFICPKCGQESQRVVKAGSVIVTEKIDNGLMFRAIERPANIEELNNERIENHKNKLKGDKLV